MARKRTPPRRSGFLTIDKPPGWTSHDVVARVRRITGERQVGHAGTLDPAASGVLPVAVGHATRVLPWIEEDRKTYIAIVRFGITTDSGDRDGRLLTRQDAAQLRGQDIEMHLASFRGEIDQVPPMQSAVKVGGRRLYHLARQGEVVEVPQRRVTVYELDLVHLESPYATLRVVCSPGTYIRSLARDLGEALGTGAMLANLIRTRSGPFTLASSISPAALEERLERYGWDRLAMHPDVVLGGLPVIVLAADDAARWANGLPVEGQANADSVRVYDAKRDWVGIGSVDRELGVIRPRRVFRGSGE